jgi:hypothetical protein
LNAEQLDRLPAGGRPGIGARLWLAFASMTGALIAGVAIAPIAGTVMMASFIILAPNVGSDATFVQPEKGPIAHRVLTEGFAAFATAALLLGTSGAVSVARRLSHAEDHASTPAIAFATVMGVLVAVPMFFLGPVFVREHLGPSGVVAFVGAAALAGTIPVRTERGVSPWVYGCLALIVAAPLAVECAWRLQRPPQPMHRVNSVEMPQRNALVPIPPQSCVARMDGVSGGSRWRSHPSVLLST